ncbi:hypothetical protein C6366_02620 [Desulfonatronum sp. SC1]|nr:hypothetical protein C6366_02620 [Desulfonatronum sp. SC1]
MEGSKVSKIKILESKEEAAFQNHWLSLSEGLSPPIGGESFGFRIFPAEGKNLFLAYSEP